MLTVTARLTAHQGKESALKENLLRLVEACKDHEGLMLYSVHQNNADPRQFLFFEQFADEAAFASHQQSPELAAEGAERAALVADKELAQWTRLAATGTHCLAALDALATRRSVRSFTDAPISDDVLQRILVAGMQAPSAGNAQPWELVVIRDAAAKQQIMDMHPYAKMAGHAPVCVLVCGNLNKEKYAGFWVQDCSAAIQNMLLAARALGVGTVWCGIHPIEEREEAFAKAFALPANVRPLGLVAMGWPQQPFTQRDVFDPKKVHQGKFGA